MPPTNGAAPGVQGPPPLIQPSGEHPANGGASHRVEQQLQQMDQTDGVQHSEQRCTLILLYHFISVHTFVIVQYGVDMCIYRSWLSLET